MNKRFTCWRSSLKIKGAWFPHNKAKPEAAKTSGRMPDIISMRTLWRTEVVHHGWHSKGNHIMATPRKIRVKARNVSVIQPREDLWDTVCDQSGN